MSQLDQLLSMDCVDQKMGILTMILQELEEVSLQVHLVYVQMVM